MLRLTSAEDEFAKNKKVKGAFKSETKLLQSFSKSLDRR
jgi:hypothetical protein